MVWNLMYNFTCRLVWLWYLFFRPKERTYTYIDSENWRHGGEY